MGEIPNKVKENVRAVLLSKTDGKGVLTTDFLKDYKSILKEPLMFKSLGFSSLKEFLNAIPDVCRLEYNENVMAFKMFGIAKPNTYASSFMKKAEGNSENNEDDDDREERGPRRGRTGGELLSLGKDLNEDWQPNCRGLYTLCFPNRFSHLNSNEAVTVKFSEVGEVADVNIIPSLVFVRFRDCDAAKQALSLWGDELRLRRADEKQPNRPRREGGDRGGDRGGNRGGGRFRGDRDEMLVNSRPRRDDRGGNAGKKYDTDYESDFGGKYVQQNSHANAEDGKKESIWAKVRQADNEQPKETEKAEIYTNVTEKKQFDRNQNQIINNDVVKSVQNSVQDTQGSTWTKKPEVTTTGLLGRHPEDINSHLLDSIAQPPDNPGKGLLGEGPGDLRSNTMNGLLAGPMVTVPLGRAAILGRQATGHSSYVNPGPISRPSASSISVSQKTSPGIHQEQIKSQLSPSAISPVAPAIIIDTQRPNTVNPQQCPRAVVEKVTDDRAEKEDEKTIQVYIGNFPHTASQEDLEELLKKYAYTACRIVTAKDNKFKRYAFVDYVSQKEAELCIEELNHFEFLSRNLQVRLGSRKSEDNKEGMKISPKPSQQSPNIQKQQNHIQEVEDDDDDDEMPELETTTPVITRTIENDKHSDKKSGRQPGAYVPKSPEKMPPLEQVSPISPISPRMPPLEQKSPPKRRQPLLPTPVPQMPQPGSAKVFDSRDLEEKMLHSERDEGDEAVQLVLTNFPYGTHEAELFSLFKDSTVHQINMMNSSVTNRSTYAFVTVKNIEQAQLAILQLDQSLMKGRRLTVGMVTPTTSKKSSLAGPIARITCTVGAQGDAGRHVSVDKSSKDGPYMPDARGDYLPDRGYHTDRGYNTDRGGYASGYQSDGYQSESGYGYQSEGGYGYQSEGGYGYQSEGSYGRPDFDRSNIDRPRQSLQEDNRKTNMRMTHILKSYAMITSKLHGEQDFMQPPHSQMTVHVTHVEDNGYFFWGQVLVDPAIRETYGPRKNIETLQRITFELQEEDSRPGPLRRLGRCAALYQGKWYRAWNLGVFDDGMNDIIYLDYGNTEAVPNKKLCDTIPEIWNIPPIVMPFRAVDAVKSKFGTMKGLEDKNVVVEIIKPGESQSNFVANVHLVDIDE